MEAAFLKSNLSNFLFGIIRSKFEDIDKSPVKVWKSLEKVIMGGKRINPDCFKWTLIKNFQIQQRIEINSDVNKHK